MYQNEVLDVTVLVGLKSDLYFGQCIERKHKHQPVSNIPRGTKMLIISTFCYEQVLKIGAI